MSKRMESMNKSLRLETVGRSLSAVPAQSGEAWSVGVGGHTPWIDLDVYGVDHAAVQQMPAEVAMAFHLIPLRAVGQRMVAAVPKDADLPADEIGKLVGKDIRLVWADANKIRAAIESHYGVTCAAA